MTVTVKQLNSASAGSEGFKVDGVELSNVRIMGRLMDISDDASTCTIMLHDGTGSIRFTLYTDATEQWAAERGTWECVRAALPPTHPHFLPPIRPSLRHNTPPPPPPALPSRAGWASTWRWWRA